MKTCNRCHKEKPLSAFHKNKNNKDGLNNRCGKCTTEYNAERYKRKRDELNAYQAQYYRNNKEKIKARQYGLTLEEYQALKESHNGKCAICDEEKQLYVDHCHTTNNVRGLLCLACNTALGNFKDNVLLLRRAIEYLGL